MREYGMGKKGLLIDRRVNNGFGLPLNIVGLSRTTQTILGA